jgi:hypothetical protein
MFAGAWTADLIARELLPPVSSSSRSMDAPGLQPLGFTSLRSGPKDTAPRGLDSVLPQIGRSTLRLHTLSLLLSESKPSTVLPDDIVSSGKHT